MTDDNKGARAVAQGTGYGNPPRSTRFRAGQSGNPDGRPKGRRSQAPYEAVLGQIVTVRDGDATRQLSAAEAFLLHLTKRGLEGDSAAARSAMHSLDDMRTRRIVGKSEDIVIVHHIVSPGSVNQALIPLRMAILQDKHRETARIMLEPWIVQAALSRLGDRRLSNREQKLVFEATRTPNKVKWPQWWTERLAP